MKCPTYIIAFTDIPSNNFIFRKTVAYQKSSDDEIEFRDFYRQLKILVAVISAFLFVQRVGKIFIKCRVEMPNSELLIARRHDMTLV